MPKLKKETEKARAQGLAQVVIKNRFNQTKVAAELGCSPQNIQKKLARKSVQDALQKYIESPELKAELTKVAKEALKAKNFTKKGSKPDHDARHKYWHDLVVASGFMKRDEVSVGVQVFCGSEIVAMIKNIENSTVKSTTKEY